MIWMMEGKRRNDFDGIAYITYYSQIQLKHPKQEPLDYNPFRKSTSKKPLGPIGALMRGKQILRDLNAPKSLTPEEEEKAWKEWKKKCQT